MTPEDREDSASLQKNRFVGFKYNRMDSTESCSPGRMHQEMPVSPASRQQRFTWQDKIMNDPHCVSDDELAEGVSVGHTTPVRVFQNRTKLTRESTTKNFYGDTFSILNEKHF